MPKLVGDSAISFSGEEGKTGADGEALRKARCRMFQRQWEIMGCCRVRRMGKGVEIIQVRIIMSHWGLNILTPIPISRKPSSALDPMPSLNLSGEVRHSIDGWPTIVRQIWNRYSLLHKLNPILSKCATLILS